MDYLVPDDAKGHEADIALFGDTCFLNEITDSDTVKYLQLEKQNHLEMANEDDTAVTRLEAVPTQGLTVNLPNVRDPEYLEHRQLCHIGKQLYDRTVAAVDGLPKVKHNPNCPCCVMAKSTKKRRSRNAWREHKAGPMQKLHMDLMGKFKHASLGGAYYALVIVDDHSWCTRMTTVIHDAQPVFLRLITLDFVLLLNKYGPH